MATSFQALLVLMTATVAASQTCNTKTSGTCSWLSCNTGRGPTDCVGGFGSKLCVCKPGYCTTDGEKCVDPNAPNAQPATTDFKKDDRVEVQDREKDVPLPGKVTNNTSPVQVQTDGSKESFAWKIVKHKSPTYKVGDEVDARDSDSQDWKQGKVTSIGEDGVKVQPDGWKTSFPFGQIRPLDYEKRTKDAAADHEKAKGEFAAALKQEVANAAAAKKASGEATTASKQATKQAIDAKNAADDAGARLKKAQTDESQKKKEESHAGVLVEVALAKQEAAHQATTAADKVRDDAAAEAAKEVAASEAAQTLAANKKALVQQAQAQEQEDINAAKTTCAEQGTTAIRKAMAAACSSAKNALNSTKLLLASYKTAQAKADKEAAQAAAASVTAKNDAAQKSVKAAAAAHDEAQEKSNTQAAQGVAAAAKGAADSATAAEKQAAAAASAAKKNSDDADTKAKEAAATADHKEKASIEATKVAEDTGKKSQAIFGTSSALLTTEFVLFQKTGPSNYDQGYFAAVATGFVAALAMFATMVWRSTRLGGIVIMPETLLG